MVPMLELLGWRSYMWLLSGVWIICCCLWMCEGLNVVFVCFEKGRRFLLCGSDVVCFMDDHGTVAAWVPRYFGLVCLQFSSCRIYMFVCLSAPSVVITISFCVWSAWVFAQASLCFCSGKQRFLCFVVVLAFVMSAKIGSVLSVKMKRAQERIAVLDKRLQ